MVSSKNYRIVMHLCLTLCIFTMAFGDEALMNIKIQEQKISSRNLRRPRWTSASSYISSSVSLKSKLYRMSGFNQQQDDAHNLKNNIDISYEKEVFVMSYSTNHPTKGPVVMESRKPSGAPGVSQFPNLVTSKLPTPTLIPSTPLTSSASPSQSIRPSPSPVITLDPTVAEDKTFANSKVPSSSSISLAPSTSFIPSNLPSFQSNHTSISPSESLSGLLQPSKTPTSIPSLLPSEFQSHLPSAFVGPPSESATDTNVPSLSLHTTSIPKESFVPTESDSSASSRLPSSREDPINSPSMNTKSESSLAPSMIHTKIFNSDQSSPSLVESSNSPITLPIDDFTAENSLIPTNERSLRPSLATFATSFSTRKPSISPFPSPIWVPPSISSTQTNGTETIFTSEAPISSQFMSSSFAPTDTPTISQHPSYSFTPTQRCLMSEEEREAAIMDLLREVSNPDALTTPNTPQNNAANWIIYEDFDFFICPDDPKLIQRYVMAIFYFSTGGEGWKECSTSLINNECPEGHNFLSGVSECQWGGVSCNNHGCMTNITFEQNGLEGLIPFELSELKELQILSLEQGLLKGTIPSSLGDLKKLKILDLDYNVLSGSIPLEVFNISSLLQLDLNNNLLTGIIPDNVGTLENLVFIQLQNNQLSGSIPTGFGKLDNIRLMEFFGNNFVGDMPQEICESRVPNGALAALTADCFGTPPQVPCACCTACAISKP